MDCEGIWKVEMNGPYGWERIATAFLKDGRYLGASADHYSVGHYKQRGKQLHISMELVQHGKLRTIFGRKSRENLHLVSRCKIKKNLLTGTTRAKGRGDFEVMVRYLRLDKLS